MAYRVYVVLLCVGLATVVGGGWVRDALAADVAATRAAAAVPFGVAAVALTALWGAVREGALRGPVSVPGPVIDWVLTSPVSWERVLGGAYARDVLARALVGAAGCVALLLVLRATVLPIAPGALGPLLWAALAGAFLGALSAGLRALDLAPRTLYFVLPLALLAVAAALTWTAGLWLGPWGWAGIVLAGEEGAPVALALLGATALGAVVVGGRRLFRVGFKELRRGAEVTAAVKGGLWVTDPGWAGVVGEGRKAEKAGRVRLPVPRRGWLLAPWRDAVGLLRDGEGCVRAAALLVVAFVAVGQGGNLWLAVGCGCLYLAASALLDGARMCALQPARARFFPGPPPMVALALGVTPLLVAGALALPAGVALALLGVDPVGLAWAVGLLPAAVGAALAGAYRGQMPPTLLAGFDTPFGNSAGFQVVFWHGAGPLALFGAALGAAGWGVPALVAATVGIGVWASRRGARAFV
ncbi:DUF6297 family protein [Actinocorallia sp. API 0066]|uniref:DUF6297 family protein n=1 Tax=Actinocorallia sp. API 0066 TaxID=2896846 RepID=UPI001E42009D|nr:DUF6297 family protein [Actinocorallia sp. API 0066]MCD0447627.1 DUF6297 family protein [Actinocorallia sp. API 0066]